MPPRISKRTELMNKLQTVRLDVMKKRKENLLHALLEDQADTLGDLDLEIDGPIIPLILPPLPPSPTHPNFGFDDLFVDPTEQRDQQYARLLGAIEALEDEIASSRVLDDKLEPPMRASQLPLLDHFAEHRPHLFRQRVRVDPDVFDCILDQISDNPVFESASNRAQIPVAIQLAVFLTRVGHYGNSSSNQHIADWAGISTGSVINCTNRVMLALLAEHDSFIVIPPADSWDAELARTLVERKTCEAWSGGIFAADGSSFNLFQKPSKFYGETFYNRKGNYSLNCQLVVMPHNLLIVDYGLGHPGSVHDAYAFQGTQMAEDPTLIPENHWIWADSAYPSKPWCVVPFKSMRTKRLSHEQKIFNVNLSRVRVCVEHAFAALKGRFQSLRDLRVRIRSPETMTYALHWIQCCLILHNMIIRFEEMLDKQPSSSWARGEPQNPVVGGPGDWGEPVVVQVGDASPGQQFQAKLMQDLFTSLGLNIAVNG